MFCILMLLPRFDMRLCMSLFSIIHRGCVTDTRLMVPTKYQGVIWIKPSIIQPRQTQCAIHEVGAQ